MKEKVKAMNQIDSDLQQKKAHTCAITGMRPHKLPFREGDAYHIEIMRKMKDEILAAVKRGYTTFLSGGAMGPDLWYAETVHELKWEYPSIKLALLLPCETQANRWPEHWRERYFNTLAHADDVTYISRAYTPSCMHERNRALVDRSSLLLAVYDSISEGGTKYTMDYAKKRGVEIRQLIAL